MLSYVSLEQIVLEQETTYIEKNGECNMNILNIFKGKQEKQNLMQKHESVQQYMEDGLRHGLPAFSVDENVYQAYIEKNGKTFSIACDEYGYQINVLKENRFEFIGKYNAMDFTEEWNTDEVDYADAHKLLTSIFALAKKDQKVS